MSIRVAAVDDHPLYRGGILFALGRECDMLVVGEGSCASDAIRIAGELAPDVIILDMTMPGGGMTALEIIARENPDVAVLVLTVDAREEQVLAALRIGARGYLLKGSGGTELVKAVRQLSEGECYVSPELAARMLTRLSVPATSPAHAEGGFSELSSREEQILSRLVEGLSNKEIANRLILSEKTIKHYVTSILQKLKVRNRVEAAILASERSASRMRPDGRGQVRLV